MSAIRVIELRGEPGERGYQHGHALRDEIGALYEQWIQDAASGPAPQSEDALLRYGAAHLPAAQAYAPDLVDEIEGIAQGAGLSFEHVFALNCFDEVSCHGPALLADALHGCTAFAAVGRATQTGTTYVGQSWDISAWYPPYIFRLVTAAGDAEALVFGHPAVIGGTGINSHGLALVWNTLKSSDARAGVPATFMVRRALQQRSMAEAVGVVITCERANGLNFIVGGSFGAVDIEVSATAYSVTYGSTFLHHANHHESPALTRYEADLPKATPDTLIRSGRMRQLLEEHYAAIDLDACQEILRDHADYPGSICRHYRPEQPGKAVQTQAALIYVPAEGKMLASNGPPCRAPFVEYALASVADMALA